MRILFFISTFKHISGGHYYSLRTIANALSEQAEVAICVIGLNESPVLKDLPFQTVYIPFNGLNYISVCNKVNKLCKDFLPDVVHTFDTYSLCFAQSMSLRHDIPLFYTKCGGPNPKRFFSFVKNLIVFHLENKDYFLQSEEFNYLNIFHIPNRIDSIVPDQGRIGELKKTHPGGFTFLRISRIGSHHEESLIQSINLINALNEEGLSVNLLIIGTIEDQGIYQKLTDLASGPFITFITDKYYTLNANTLIDIGDFIIGAGRSLMEAASLGKVLLTPAKNSKFPVLVQPEIFDELFYYNFSDRTVLKNFSESDNYALIRDLVKNNKKQAEYVNYSFHYFKQYFDVKKVIKEYLTIYSESKVFREKHRIDYIICVLRTIKENFYWQFH
jgi:glycosyltransferase involved in cell wall biosynthesis